MLYWGATCHDQGVWKQRMSSGLLPRLDAAGRRDLARRLASDHGRRRGARVVAPAARASVPDGVVRDVPPASLSRAPVRPGCAPLPPSLSPWSRRTATAAVASDTAEIVRRATLSGHPRRGADERGIDICRFSVRCNLYQNTERCVSIV